jgi:DNA-binding response OmpR family regulator
VVDDEVNIRFFLQETLSREGYQVTAAENGNAALKVLDQDEFDLALIDLHMPGSIKGIDLLSILHQRSPTTIAIILTGYASLDTAIEALRQDAYDYLFKPSHSSEIKEKVRNGLLKRAQEHRQQVLLTRLEQKLNEDLEEIRAAVHPTISPTPDRIIETKTEEVSSIQWEDLVMDLNQYTARLHGQLMDLSPSEFKLLAYLITEAPKVVSSQKLAREVQGGNCQPWEAREIVRYHVYHIRIKAKKASGRDDLIRTVRSVGYTLAR